MCLLNRAQQALADKSGGLQTPSRTVKVNFTSGFVGFVVFCFFSPVRQDKWLLSPFIRSHTVKNQKSSSLLKSFEAVVCRSFHVKAMLSMP